MTIASELQDIRARLDLLEEAAGRGMRATPLMDVRVAMPPTIYRKEIRGREYVAVARDVGTSEAMRADGWRP